MNDPHPQEMQARSALRALPLAADAGRVNRTHRVIRARAVAMQEERRQRRSLWLPLTIASVMLAMICYAVWTSFSLTDIDISEVSDTVANTFSDGGQIMMVSLWFLPVTATALFFAWFRQRRSNRGDSV